MLHVLLLTVDCIIVIHKIKRLSKRRHTSNNQDHLETRTKPYFSIKHDQVDTSVHQLITITACLFIYLSIYLTIYLSIYLSILNFFALHVLHIVSYFATHQYLITTPLKQWNGFYSFSQIHDFVDKWTQAIFVKRLI